MNEWLRLDERNRVLRSKKKSIIKTYLMSLLIEHINGLPCGKRSRARLAIAKPSLPSVWFEPVEKTICSLGIDRSAVTPDSSEVADVHLQSSSPI
jgi:hypothetical protein